jgi:hypothetical protein
VAYVIFNPASRGLETCAVEDMPVGLLSRYLNRAPLLTFYHLSSNAFSVLGIPYYYYFQTTLLRMAVVFHSIQE